MPVPSCSTVIAFSLASPPTVRGRPPVGSDLPELDGTDLRRAVPKLQRARRRRAPATARGLHDRHRCGRSGPLMPLTMRPIGLKHAWQHQNEHQREGPPCAL